jgi:hypothetical protein
VTGNDNKPDVKLVSRTLSFYQRKIEDFYDDLAEAFKKLGVNAFYEGSSLIEEIEDPDLLVFEQNTSYEPYDNQAEEFLQEMLKKGYEILLNFQAPDVILGNVVVKIGDKWFAFGQCKNDQDAGPYVNEIWSLKYVLTRLPKMKIKLVYTIPLTKP